MSEGIDDLNQQVDELLAEHARLSERLSDAEMRDILVTRQANFYVSDQGWRVAHPDNPAMRLHLISEDAQDPEFADAVLAKMREIAAGRPPGWDLG